MPTQVATVRSHRHKLTKMKRIVNSGNGGLTYDEAKSHFTAWALMKSPLLIGTNVWICYPDRMLNHDRFQLSAITQETLSVLKNREIIAINQDPVEGASVSPFRWGINVSLLFAFIHMMVVTGKTLARLDE